MITPTTVAIRPPGEDLVEMHRFCVYIMTNERLTVLYVGSTADLERRLKQHKRRVLPGFTKRYNVHRLVYFERFPDLKAARSRERQLKGLSRAKKEALIKGLNAFWLDLAAQV